LDSTENGEERWIWVRAVGGGGAVDGGAVVRIRARLSTADADAKEQKRLSTSRSLSHTHTERLPSWRPSLSLYQHTFGESPSQSNGGEKEGGNKTPLLLPLDRRASLSSCEREGVQPHRPAGVPDDALEPLD
jgi:hypothetical protein